MGKSRTKIKNPSAIAFLTTHGCSVRSIALAMGVSPQGIAKCLKTHSRQGDSLGKRKTPFSRKRGVAKIVPGTIVAFPTDNFGVIVTDRCKENKGFHKTNEGDCLLLHLERNGEQMLSVNTIVNLGHGQG